MKRYLFPLILLTLTLTACTDNYKACNQAGQVIAATVTSADSTILALQKAGTITSAEALNLAGFFEFVNQSNESFLKCAQIAHTNGNVVGSYTACTTTFLTQIGNPQELLLVHVSNAGSQATVQSIINGILSGAQALQASLGGA